MANKKKFNKQTIKKVCEYILQGLSQEKACLLAKISERTYQRYKKDNQFDTLIKRMEAKRQLIFLGKLRNETGNNWLKYAWLLERIYPQEFGKIINQKLDHLSDGKKIDIIFGIPRPEDNSKIKKI